MHVHIDAHIQTLKSVCTQVESYRACEKNVYTVFQEESALL